MITIFFHVEFSTFNDTECPECPLVDTPCRLSIVSAYYCIRDTYSSVRTQFFREDFSWNVPARREMRVEYWNRRLTSIFSRSRHVLPTVSSMSGALPPSENRVYRVLSYYDARAAYYNTSIHDDGVLRPIKRRATPPLRDATDSFAQQRLLILLPAGSKGKLVFLNLISSNAAPGSPRLYTAARPLLDFFPCSLPVNINIYAYKLYGCVQHTHTHRGRSLIALFPNFLHSHPHACVICNSKLRLSNIYCCNSWCCMWFFFDELSFKINCSSPRVRGSPIRPQPRYCYMYYCTNAFNILYMSCIIHACVNI